MVSLKEKAESKRIAEIINQEFDTVVRFQESGMSKPYDHPGHGRGRFDFSAEPENVGGVGGTRYLFITETGDTYHLPIERRYQGGRWERSHHAQSDWDRYRGLSSEEQRNKMYAMWGPSELSDVLINLLEDDSSFIEMRRALKPYDTWRSISAGEPGS